MSGLKHSVRGNYYFLPGGIPYSSGVVAAEGYGIAHVTLLEPLPYRRGFEHAAAFLKSAGRPRHALCAVELRIGAPFSREGFVEFNTGYRSLIDEWDLPVDGDNPVARTNVAPQWNVPDQPSLHAFSYTTPATEGRQTFVVAGAGEMRGGSTTEAQVVRAGETTPNAMREKADYVMSVMKSRMSALGVNWDLVTTTNLYTVRAMDEVFGSILHGMGSASRRGINFIHSRPPVADLEFEMDVRGVIREEFIA